MTALEALKELVAALDATNWSSWQTTARFGKQLESARAAIAAQPEGEPPAKCDTYETTSGDTVICKRCGECWPRGAERACVRAIKLLKHAGIERAPQALEAEPQQSNLKRRLTDEQIEAKWIALMAHVERSR